jgi:hypothetical protein
MKISSSKIHENKKEYISDIGEILVRDYGKKKFYKPTEIKKSHRISKWYDGVDFSCWAMSVFSSHSDFDVYHQQTGEICSYTEMRTDMLEVFSAAEGISLSSLVDFDIDASWLDFGDIFGDVTDFFGDIFN